VLFRSGFADFGAVGTVAEVDVDGDLSFSCVDCDDNDILNFPGNPEVCDGQDNDCNAATVEGSEELTNATGLPQAIPDNNLAGVTSTLLVTEDLPIGDVDVLVDISHTWVGDLTIELTSPGGTTVTLSAQNGGSGDDYDATLFNDEATTAISAGTAPFAGEFQPDGLLSSFDGQQSAGIWTLSVVDGFTNDIGTLDAWGVEITSAATIDADTDGSFFCVDCDDNDILNSPAFVEVCDGQDNDCDGTGDGNVAGSGDDDGCSGVDCDAIQTAFPTSPDGIYWIDPLASGNAYEVFCDQSLDGGGWTLVANIDDVNDPYFGGHTTAFGTDWINAWESDSTRNTTQIPDYSNQVFVSSKYRSFSEVVATDIKIMYMNGIAAGQQLTAPYMVGAGLSTTGTLDVLFAVPSNVRGQCTSTFTSVTQTRLAGGTSNPQGLNCSDSNQDWYDVDPSAENARIGGQDSDFSLSMNAWLGAMGDRGFSQANYEKTWAEFSTGTVFDRDVLLFVR
jgi:subtilisin-like proprotein convertase family protein